MIIDYIHPIQFTPHEIYFTKQHMHRSRTYMNRLRIIYANHWPTYNNLSCALMETDLKSLSDTDLCTVQFMMHPSLPAMSKDYIAC